MPSGKRKPVFFSEGQSKLSIVNDVLLPHWKEYCLRHWMDEKQDSNHSRESSVKRFLDDVAYLLLRDNPEGTLSRYKIRAVGSMEIDVSSCSPHYEDMMYGNGATRNTANDSAAFGLLLDTLDETAPETKMRSKPKPRPMTRFEKIERLKKRWPKCSIAWCPVDTEGLFVFGGEAFLIDGSAVQYQCLETREGEYYGMDRVLALRTQEDEMHFYDQNADGITELVYRRCTMDEGE